MQQLMAASATRGGRHKYQRLTARSLTRTGTLRARVRTPSLKTIAAVSPFEREAGLLTRPKAARAAPVAHLARVYLYRWVSLSLGSVCATQRSSIANSPSADDKGTLRPVRIPPVSFGPSAAGIADHRILIARAARMARVLSEMDDCTIMIALAHRESTGTSVGENAVLVLKATNT